MTSTRNTMLEAVPGEKQYQSHWSLLLWFVVVAVIVGVLLFLFKPTWVLKTGSTTEVDFAKVLLWSLGIALVVILIVALVRGSSMKMC